MHRLEPIPAGTTAVTLYDFGGVGPTALFVHGAGFTGSCLAPLAEMLTARWHCWAVDLGGHGRSGRPESFEWDEFVEEVRAVLEFLGERVIGFGHSLGASTLIGAAVRSPAAIAELYCYEPIVISDDLPTRPPPGLAEMTLRRRATFASRAEARAHFQSRPPFSAFDERALDGYLNDGLVEDPDGVRLACRPVDESAVYEAAERFDTFSLLRSLETPITIGYGTQSLVLSKEAAALLAGSLKGGAQVAEFARADHLAPYAAPEAVAESVIRAIGTAGA